MTKIIDNSKEKLASALTQEFSDMSEIAIASAYFNVYGYGALKDALGDKRLLFLLGREPTESIKWEEEVIRELEEKEDDLRYFNLLQDAVKYFEDPKREIRILNGPFFHGKAYIGASPSLKEVKRGVGCVGSSNFTYGGLLSNRELNMLNSDKEVVEDLIKWYYDQWNSSKDFKGQFLSFLKNYVTTRTPYEVVAKALYETYKSSIGAAEDVQQLKTLHPHQILSYRDASLKLQKYGGVLIADATGLGKSRTALRLALDAIRDGKKVLLIAPKSILDTTWHDEMEKTNIFVETVSSEKLSEDPDYVTKKYEDRNFIIVDEAHYFRRPSTNRYTALRNLIIKNKAQVVLATATPVNTSLMDLYFLFSLYLDENSVFDLYGKTLRGLFTENQKSWLNNQPIDLEPVLERFIVRHSRELAKALDREGKLRFPQRVLDNDPRNKYSTDINYQRIYDILSQMNFAFYDLAVEKLSNLSLPDGTPISKAVESQKLDSLKKLVKIIVIINIFKRLESSIEAFKTTITALDDYMDRAMNYAKEKGYFVPPALKDDPIFSLDEEMPDPEDLFSKPKYALMKEKCGLAPNEVSDFIEKCEEDMGKIEDLLKVIPQADKKFESFESRIKDIVQSITSNNGLIIFTQYTTTAKYLYGKLRSEMTLPVMLVTGSVCYNKGYKKNTKTEVVRDFQREGGILVSTDVLSEGQNLQNAQYVANYDFPWNPVVLIQRIGRVDRMGSIHDKVFIINVLPKNGDPNDPSSLEHFIGLMEKLYRRLEGIRETIGLDASTLGEEAAPKDFGVQEALAKNDQQILDQLSKELDQFTSDPKDTLARIMNEKGLDWLEGLPNGIGAYKEGDRPGLFILFTDGDEFYWKLKYYDQNGGSASSPSEIVDILLKGDSQNKGQTIEYGQLIEHMKEMKSELKQELESRIRREKTLLNTPSRATQTIKEIYEALANSGEDGEVLANSFRDSSNRQGVVNALKQALQEGNLNQKARELLKSEGTSIEQEKEKEIKLTRVCWCWIQPNLSKNVVNYQ